MHKNSTAIILIMLAFSAALAEASYQQFACGAPGPVDAPHNFACGSGASPTIWCSYDDFNSRFITDDCAPKCAKGCGQLNSCHTVAAQTCEQCCGTNSPQSRCDGKGYGAYSWGACFFPTSLGGKEACSCQQSCIGTCEVNKDFCDVINLLKIVVGIAAAIIIAIHGVMWIKSEDAHGRDDARRGIWYVIVGVIVIAMAGTIVAFLLGKSLVC
jgi:hypothetical protein